MQILSDLKHLRSSLTRESRSILVAVSLAKCIEIYLIFLGITMVARGGYIGTEGMQLFIVKSVLRKKGLRHRDLLEKNSYKSVT